MFAVILVSAISSVAVAVAFGALTALPVMWLWNACVAGYFPIGEIGYFHAWGLVILSNLLFSATSKTEQNK